MISGVSAVWLPVSDMERALGFYGQTLGFEVTQQDDDWSQLKAGGVSIGLNGNASESPSGDGGAAIAFESGGSIEDEVERLKGEGVEFAGEISDHPWGRIATFKDPDGNDLQLYAPPA